METSCVICYRPITRTTVLRSSSYPFSEIDSPSMFSLLLLPLHRSLAEAARHLSDMLESVMAVVSYSFAAAGCSSTLFVRMMTTGSSQFVQILSIWVCPSTHFHLECDCSPPVDSKQSAVYRPHMFINERGEYECTVVETNRIRALCHLPPLESIDCWNNRCGDVVIYSFERLSYNKNDM